MAKQLLIISLDWTRPKDPPSSLGHASILALLKQENIAVIEKSWSVNKKDFQVQDVVQFILTHYDLDTYCAMGAFVWNESYIQEILNGIYSKFKERIILGGPQISYVKSGLEKLYPNANIFIRGYAEFALLTFLKSEEKHPIIRGIHYKGEPDLGLSANAELDKLPSPYLTNTLYPKQFARWETQRGCPFQCSFCQHRQTNTTYLQRRTFQKSRTQKEVTWFVQNEISDIAVLDPTFNSGPSYLDTLEFLIQEGYKEKIALQCRPEMMNEFFIEKIIKLNRKAHVVLEFGLQTIHKNEQKIIQRPNNLKKIIEVFNLCNSHSIDFEVSLIFGLPEQTIDSFKASIMFCKTMNVPRIHAFPLMLLRGTLLHDQKHKLKLIESHEVAHPEINRLQAQIPHVVSSQTFTYTDWKKMADLAADLEINYNKTGLSERAAMVM